MKEVINIKNDYDENSQLIQQDADVYSFVDSEVFTASGGYQIIRSYFVRERDQKLFEARNREGFEPQKMVLLERNRAIPPKRPNSKDYRDLRTLALEKLKIDLNDVRLFLEENGYKIVENGREKNGQTATSDDTVQQ